MTKKKFTYLDALGNITDGCIEHCNSLSTEELQKEHAAIYENSTDRIKNVKSILKNCVLERKKEILNSIDSNINSTKKSDNILTSIRDKYGDLRSFLNDKILNNADIPGELTFEFRNKQSTSEEEIGFLIEDLIEMGALNEEDIEN
jgi:hypothetical protein